MIAGLVVILVVVVVVASVMVVVMDVAVYDGVPTADWHYCIVILMVITVLGLL